MLLRLSSIGPGSYRTVPRSVVNVCKALRSEFDCSRWLASGPPISRNFQSCGVPR